MSSEIFTTFIRMLNPQWQTPPGSVLAGSVRKIRNVQIRRSTESRSQACEPIRQYVNT